MQMANMLLDMVPQGLPPGTIGFFGRNALYAATSFPNEVKHVVKKRKAKAERKQRMASLERICPSKRLHISGSGYYG